MRALVVGATSWGCTLALQIDRAGHQAHVLCRTPDEAADLARRRENHRLLPGIALPETLAFVDHPTPADCIVLAVPAQRLRDNLRPLLPHLDPNTPLVSAAKGLERDTLLRMSQVITEECAGVAHDTPVAVISGPNLAREIAVGQPATTVVASAHRPTAERVRELLMTPGFRVYTNPDVVGVELGGALKNVIAIGVGIGEALGAGDNGRAAFLTRGLAEIARLGAALGANPLTFTGLAGLGDLIATCDSPRSRNHTLGLEIGRGRPLADVLAGMVHVAEGVDTTRAAVALADRHHVDLPIARAVYDVLFRRLDPALAIRGLMTRAAQDEIDPAARSG